MARCLAYAALLQGAALAATVQINASVTNLVGWDAPDAWATLTLWDYTPFQSPVPPGTSAQYPFLRRIELFTATGGCYIGFPGCSSTRDLYANGSDPANGYNFNPILTAVSNVLSAGFTPHIVTGNVPIALSDAPYIGAFGFNSAPALNATLYLNYMTALTSALVFKFTAPVVRRFWFGVYTEANNVDWFSGTPQQYFDLYDVTACALGGVLGLEGLMLGVHLCTQCFDGPRAKSGSWDTRLMIAHLANGSNACSGGSGSPVAWISNSFYEDGPEEPGDLSWFVPNMNILQATAAEYGLSGLVWGIDEGRLLSGPAWEGSNVPLTTRAIGDSYQASFDAMFYAAMLRLNISYYSRWGVNTDGGNGLWTWPYGRVDTVATNLARLTHRMTGEALAVVSNTSVAAEGGDGASESPPSIIDGVVSVAADGSVHALVYHHHPWMNASVNATAVVNICGLAAAATSASGTLWSLGDACGNYWAAWWQDRAALNLTQYNQGWSAYSDALTFYNTTQEDYFYTTLAPRYERMTNLSACAQAWSAPVTDGCVTQTWDMVPHSVLLLEMSVT